MTSGRLTRTGLDFLVIGAQKSGTTTLWHLLSDHPQLALPGAKEAPYFSEDRVYALGMAAYLGAFFAASPDEVKRGTVTPQYMVGSATVGVAEVAARIGRELPEVRLIALLRDPVQRAISHHRMSVRRGSERRPVDRALSEQLAPGALATARLPPRRSAPRDARDRVYANTRYVVAGEYGRILGHYRRYYDRSQTLVLLTSELDADPGNLVAKVLRFLEVDETWRPRDLHARHFVGGDRSRLATEDLLSLRRALLATLPGAPSTLFDHVLNEWNTIPEPADVRLSEPLEARLREHFARDAELLEQDWGVRVPWAGSAAAPGGADDRAGATDRHNGVRSRAASGEPPMASLRRLSAQIGDALASDHGYALIQIGGDELAILSELVSGCGPNGRPVPGVWDRRAAAEALRQAMSDADAVALIADPPGPAEPDEWRRILTRAGEWHLRCPAEMLEELFGIGPVTAGRRRCSDVGRLLRDRVVAVVGPPSSVEALPGPDSGDAAQSAPLAVSVTIALDHMRGLDRAFQALAAQREAYDLVLLLGQVPAKPLCVRIARELDVVALEVGAVPPTGGLPTSP